MTGSADTSGALVLVVGASGVGKDTMLHAARRALGDDPRFVFPRRTITRPPDASEDNDPVSPDEFMRLAANGAFALSWSAHGLHYGIPREIEAALGAGRVVVCNVSRTIVSEARDAYANVVVVEIAVPVDVRAARIAARGRETIADATARLSRDVGRNHTVDHVIDNSGPPHVAGAAFTKLLVSLARG